MELATGQTIELGPLGTGIQLELQASVHLRGTVLGLGAHFELLSPAYATPLGGQTPDGAVRTSSTPTGLMIEAFPARLPAEVGRLFILCELAAEVRSLSLKFGSHRFDVLSGHPSGQSLIVAQFYRHGNVWYLHGIGKGFPGNLEALLRSFDPAQYVASAPSPQPQQSVKLLRNESVNLSLLSAAPLRQVAFALGWEPLESGEAVDLDGSCLAFNAEKKVRDKIWFWHLAGCRNSVRHSGDNLTGEGTGDLETITVDLMALPEQIRWLVFTVNSFRGHRFSRVREAYCRVSNLEDGRELAHYELRDAGDVTGVVMAKLERLPDGWKFTALGVPAGGMTVNALVKPARAVL